MTNNPTVHTQTALSHLNRIKPSDGWAADVYLHSSGKTLVRLLRRNAPLSDRGFDDIVYDVSGSGCVVGITSVEHQGIVGRGKVLVEADGTVCRTLRDTRVTMPKPGQQQRGAEEEVNASRARARADRERTREAVGRARDRQSQTGSAVPSAPPAEGFSQEGFSEEQHKQFLQYALLAVASAVVMKALFTAMFALYIILFPAVYIFAVHSCPSPESFDPKKELKRVLRGAHLPEDHPEKPKSFLERSFAKIRASVTTEIATGLGYEVSLYSVLGACTLATVRVPAVNADCYWIGIFGKWRYIMQRQIPEDEKVD